MGLKPRSQVPARLELGRGAELRPIARGDSRELFALIESNRDRLREWMPWVDDTRSFAEVDMFVQTSVGAARRGTARRFAIAIDGEIAGVLSFEAIDRVHRRASIGYWIDGASEGRGVVTRAVIALCDLGFATLGLNRIEIHCGIENWRSRRIPERLGFTNEGVLREREWLNDHFVDHALYAMLAADWRRA